MTDQENNKAEIEQVDELKATEKHHTAKKLDTIGWALFFIWVGIAFLVDFGDGIGLLGVGIITLGVQIARRHYDLKLEGFWIVVGLLFMIGGLWELVETKLPLVPILLIIAGLLVLVSTFIGGKKIK